MKKIEIEKSVLDKMLTGISGEREYEKALKYDRKLRLMSKEDSRYTSIRKMLRDEIQKYEEIHWKL
jgi:hypothetical protein